jgi:hypothetical protein
MCGLACWVIIPLVSLFSVPVCHMLQTKLLQLVHDIPLATHASLWFIHDEVLAHFSHQDSHTGGLDMVDPWHGQHVHLT